MVSVRNRVHQNRSQGHSKAKSGASGRQGKTADFDSQAKPVPIATKLRKANRGFAGLYSRRINVQHRLVYEVLEDAKTVKIVSLWTHYDKV